MECLTLVKKLLFEYSYISSTIFLGQNMLVVPHLHHIVLFDHSRLYPVHLYNYNIQGQGCLTLSKEINLFYFNQTTVCASCRAVYYRYAPLQFFSIACILTFATSCSWTPWPLNLRVHRVFKRIRWSICCFFFQLL